MSIKAVGFDIDGTLYPNNAMYIKSIPFFLRKPFLIYHFGIVRKQLRRIPYTGDFREAQAKFLARRLNIKNDEAYDLIEREIYKGWAPYFDRLRLYPDVARVLAAIKAKGLKLGAMSDFPVEDKLKRLGIEGLWHTAFSSEDTGKLKPYKEPFLHLAAQLGVKAEEVLYVGNNYEYDVIGSKNAGMQAAHLTRRPVKTGEADFSFYHFRDLEKYIRENM